jgi:hypothetical protein
VNSLLDDIDNEMATLANHHNTEIVKASKSIIEANNTARKVAAHILGGANTPRRPAASGSNYLMLLGTLCGGWLMTRSGAAAADALAKGETGAIGNDDFMKIKLTTMQIYITHHLPKISGLACTITDGDNPALAMQPEWL